MPTKAELERQNQELMNQLSELTNKLDTIMTQNMDLSNQVFKLTKMLFGSRSEKTKGTNEEIDGNQTSLFDEESDFFVPMNEEEGELKKTLVLQHKRKRRKRGWKDKQLENLPTEEFDHTIDEPVCDCCGYEMHELGVKDWSEVVLVPAKLVRQLHHVHSYECRQCKKNGTNQIQTAPSLKRALPGSIASPSMIAEAAYMKFEQFVPLERQLKDWSRLGLTLYSRTLVDWVNKVAEKFLKPVYDELKRQLLKQTIIAADETPYRIIKRSDGKSGKSKSQNWVYRTVASANRAIIVFDSTLTRGREELRRFLGDWIGIILCDGYSVYDKIDGVDFANCWVHARRYWNDALELGGKHPSPQVKLGKEMCDALFRMEKDWKELSLEERHQLHQKYSKPILDDFFKWMEGTFAAPKSALEKALTYCLNRKEGLMKFLDHRDLPIHNNDSENAIRPLTLGRKNWLFSTSEWGGKANAIYLSLVETCKANKIDFRQYLEKLITELPGLDLIQNPNLIRDYLPWSEKIVQSCQPLKNIDQKA